MIKKPLALISIGITSAFVAGLVTFSVANGERTSKTAIAQGQEPNLLNLNDYSLSLTSENRLSESKVIRTALGNTIDFVHSGLNTYQSGWETVSSDGYFANSTPISGMETITLNFSGELAITYGFDSSLGDWAIPLTSGEPFDFYGERPSYFIVRNYAASNANILSATIDYECSESEQQEGSPSANMSNLTFTLSSTYYEVEKANSFNGGDVVVPTLYNGKYVRRIRNDGFYNATSMTSIEIPSSVTYIGEYVFSGCSSLKSVKLRANVLSISTNMFYGLSSLESIELPADLRTIGNYAFSYCSKLSSVNIPSTVTSIGEKAFYSCSSLTFVAIPDGVTSIARYTFTYCSRLEGVVIPSGVTSIGNSAFDGSWGISSVYYGGTANSWNSISIDSYNTYLTGATRYYYSAYQPVQNPGSYWHYVDGVPTVWGA